jgi:hypothetical protein
VSAPVLPRAMSRPPVRDAGRVSDQDRQTAETALLITGGAGYIVLHRRGTTKPGKRAARVAKAWNRMVSEAEARHESFWAKHDRREGTRSC